jgi:uncharacterized linocin/CFP29 family protein
MTDNLVLSESFAPDLMNKIEETAVSAARDILSGRRIIDVEGPYGLGLTTLEVGNDDVCREPGPGEASAVVSRALSLPMIYRRFSLSKRRIAAFQEMGQPPNLKVAQDAAQAVAMREEEFIYHGQPDFHLQGLLTAEGRNTLQGGDWGSVDQVLDNVIAAVNALDGKGYRGPYGLALAPALHARHCQSANRGRCLGRQRCRLYRSGTGSSNRLSQSRCGSRKLCRHRVTGSKD